MEDQNNNREQTKKENKSIGEEIGGAIGIIVRTVKLVAGKEVYD